MIRWLVVVVLVAFFPGLVRGVFTGVGELFSNTAWIPLIVGLAGGLFLRRTVGRNPTLQGLATTSHETKHMLAGMLFLRWPAEFHATFNHGGLYQPANRGIGGRVGDDFVSLAPYCFPPATIVLSLLFPVISGTVATNVFIGATGIALGWHLFSSIMETPRAYTRQPFQVSGSDQWLHSDVANSGFIFSSLYIPAMNLLFIGVIIRLLATGYSGIVVWAGEVYQGTLSVYSALAGLH